MEIQIFVPCHLFQCILCRFMKEVTKQHIYRDIHFSNLFCFCLISYHSLAQTLISLYRYTFHKGILVLFAQASRQIPFIPIKVFHETCHWGYECQRIERFLLQTSELLKWWHVQVSLHTYVSKPKQDQQDWTAVIWVVKILVTPWLFIELVHHVTNLNLANMLIYDPTPADLMISTSTSALLCQQC